MVLWWVSKQWRKRLPHNPTSRYTLAGITRSPPNAHVLDITFAIFDKTKQTLAGQSASRAHCVASIFLAAVRPHCHHFPSWGEQIHATIAIMPPADQLLQLPRELRDEIFVIFFASTRLTFGMRYNAVQGERLMKPAPYSLGLLRTCKQINAETRDMWIKHALFNFEDPKTMLNKLSELPDSTVSKIRHLRLTGFPMMRYLKGFDDLMYRHDSVFQLLPALRLDCLTIVAIPPAAPEYDAITNLIHRGAGWKELRYITRSSSMLGFSPSRSHGSRETGDICRQPQPRFWNRTLLKRDGEASGASVQIYRAEEADNTASVLSPNRRESFEQSPHEDKNREFGLSDDEEMTKGAGARKALLVLVKRGGNMDIGKCNVGFGKERDMKARFKNRSWRGRKKIIVWTPLDHDKNDDDDLGTGWARPLTRPPALAYDNYTDIDEI